MRKIALTYIKPANEVTAGDRILTNRMTVAEVESVESFEDSTQRPCVVAVIRSGGQIVAMNFLADEILFVVV
jgi:hypothetical protein